MSDTRAVLTHAWKMVTANRSTTLRLVLVPWVTMFVTTYGVNYIEFGYFFGDVFYDPELYDSNGPLPQQDGGFGLWHLLFGILSILSWIWLAVGWHRYVLEGESPSGWIPPWAPSRNWRYLVKGFFATLPLIPMFAIFVILAIGIGIDEVLIGGPEYAFSRPRLLLGFIISSIIIYVTFRFGPILPAAAMDKSMKLRDAWKLTAPLGGVLVNLAVIAALLYVPFNALSSLYATNNFLFLVFTAASDAVSLLTLSILTVLYGHLVEGRNIA